MRVATDFDEICWAFEDVSFDTRYYLDLKTGEIIFVSDFMDREEIEEIREKLDAEFGERYILIPKMDPSEGYRDMEDFIETVQDENLKEKLYIAIDGRGAFRRFKNVLLNYPEERKRWFKFKDARVRERVKEWLDAKGIEIIHTKTL
ncbi:MAG: hypothetical protein KIH08_13315 [Candidatus Freyarchaeota archaeon]|nr:hypothetical protein [Candidatus Jordarchaeia archaeon]MBS7270246.1 hypothetical protein [Candidatus Jordarchaeia archaeon]MBS7280589.1 hypothetical protein [Candidatus Jordarchaeia archaeon]